VPAAPEIATALGIEVDDPVVERTRLVLLDGEPVEVASSYYPEHIGQGTALAEPGRIKGGAVSLLADLGYIGDHAEESVSSRPPTADEKALLGIGGSEWVLHLARAVRAADGSAIQADSMTMLARGRFLHYTVKIG
jgi:DNA-binding GntR family transcriptional regulator